MLLCLEFIVGVVHDKPLFIFNSWLMDKDVHCEEIDGGAWLVSMVVCAESYLVH